MPADGVVFLLDVDNTLLDNDRFNADLDARLRRDFGAPQQARYRTIYETLRDELGYADYLGALQRFRIGLDDDADVLQLSSFVLDYPFSERLYPRALEAIAHLRTLGTPVVLSDGDIVLQPRKVQRCGVWDACEGRVLIYLHKERMLDAMQRRYPARHYVMVDDKPRLLAAMKRVLRDTLTTVFVRQGHYAQEQVLAADDPAHDLVIERIGDLCSLQLADFQQHAGRMQSATTQKGVLRTREHP